MLETQLKEVEAKIQAACDRAGRKREEVTLIAVSKTKPIEMLQEAYDLGVRVFGENKVQEITAKYDALPDDIHWHMIGHLQTNKIKYIIDKVDLIHSVDSVKLAETIEKEAAKHNLTANILIEVNVAQEESKFGLKTEEVLPFIEKIANFEHIKVCGLMTIAPFVDNPEENRHIFANLHKLSVDINEKNIDNVYDREAVQCTPGKPKKNLGWLHILIGLAIIVFFWSVPPFEPITKLGMRCVGAFLGMVYLWSTADTMWPSLLGLFLFGIAGYDAGGFNGVWLNAVGNYTVLLTLFAMVLFGAVDEVGDTKYIARWFLTKKIFKGGMCL